MVHGHVASTLIRLNSKYRPILKVGIGPEGHGSLVPTLLMLVGVEIVGPGAILERRRPPSILTLEPILRLPHLLVLH